MFGSVYVVLEEVFSSTALLTRLPSVNADYPESTSKPTHVPSVKPLGARTAKQRKYRSAALASQERKYGSERVRLKGRCVSV
jgi:hypothetical protein